MFCFSQDTHFLIEYPFVSVSVLKVYIPLDKYFKVMTDGIRIFVLSRKKQSA